MTLVKPQRAQAASAGEVRRAMVVKRGGMNQPRGNDAGFTSKKALSKGVFRMRKISMLGMSSEVRGLR